MKKRHAASTVVNVTTCGYECTDNEYKKMRGRDAADVNCLRCIEAKNLTLRGRILANG
jgi:hypothetical protein